MARRFSLARAKVTAPDGTEVVASGTTTVRDNVLRVLDGSTEVLVVEGITAVRGVRAGRWEVTAPSGTYLVARTVGGCGCSAGK